MKTLMIVAWLSGAGTDAASTQYALAHGSREVVLTQRSSINTPVIVGEGAAGAFSLAHLYKTHPKAAVIAGIAAGVFRTSIAVHNVSVVNGGRR